MFKISLSSIKVSRIIRATPEKVWDMLTDTERWTQWGPTVRAVQSETRYIQAGSTGYVKTLLGFWTPFTITEWKHRQYWSWHVFNIRATGHQIEMIASGGCRLIFEVPLWAAPYAIICQIAANRIARILQADDSLD